MMGKNLNAHQYVPGYVNYNVTTEWNEMHLLQFLLKMQWINQ